MERKRTPAGGAGNVGGNPGGVALVDSTTHCPEVIMIQTLLFRAAVAAATVSAASACMVIVDGAGLDGSGRISSESRDVSGFDRIAVEDEFDVEVTVGPAASLSLTADDNLLPHVRTVVRNGTLHLETERELDPTDEIRIRVTVPALRGLSASGSSAIRASGVRSATFDTSVSGSADLRADGDFGALEASISGSGSIRLQGTAQSVEASVSGSGDLDLAQVPSRTATVRVSGSGDAAVHATETLDATVSGSGDVRYVGSPRVETQISGSGSVRPVSRG